MSNWQEFALCAGTAQPRNKKGEVVDWFFDTYEKDAETRRQVRELCNSCPVQKACRYTGEKDKMVGVWGGVWLENGVLAEDKFE